MDFVPDPVHDFIDVEDVVDGIMALVNGKRVGTYELGSGMAYSNADILKIVEDTCQSKANIQIRKSMRSYDSTEWYCKSRGWGWSAKKTIFESIREMVDHAKSTR
jgi:nucleoside-diphosphate-sugar epimerase